MTADEIRAAYGFFVSLLRDGAFAPPVDGWTAELVAAHVALNNHEFARVAEDVRARRPAAYDNTAAVDEARLCAFVGRTGSLAALADEVEASVDRLARACAALTEEQAATVVPIRIRHDGAEVVDEPGALGEWIDGNATTHLQGHVRQLNALLLSG